MSGNSISPGGDYFNGLGQSIADGDRQNSVSPNESYHAAASASRTEPGDGLPRLKRIACVVCRKRKLKCDSAKPSCKSCLRLGHECAYDEIRRKSGPKRGYVKALEARLGR